MKITEHQSLEKIFELEENQRLGRTLLTFYYNNQPLGSLLLNPTEDKEIIEDVKSTITRWNSLKSEKLKKSIARQDERKSSRDD